MTRIYPDTKNTTNWQLSINRRIELLGKAEQLKLILDNPHNMKLADLQTYIDNAERWRVK